ncbi:MAG: alpha/beta fold hydrolase [Phenylobacterium sp.]
MKNFTVVTSEGEIVFTAKHRDPKVLMFHGFMREANHVLHWRDLIEDIGFVHLPGHNFAPELKETSLEAWIRGFRHMMTIFSRPPLIIAESLGAVIAMSIPSRAVIAVDPPLSVDQLWPLRRAVAQARGRGTAVDPRLEAMFDRPFHWVLDRISAPVFLLAGTEPLLPERRIDRAPSILTDDDLAAYSAHPMVEAVRIEGGHELLVSNPAGVLAATAPFMARHGYPLAAGPWTGPIEDRAS